MVLPLGLKLRMYWVHAHQQHRYTMSHVPVWGKIATKSCIQASVQLWQKNTYLDQIKSNRITVDGMIYMLSPIDLENLNSGPGQ